VTISLTEDIWPITELKRQMPKALAQIHRTGRPLILTVNGKPDAVLLDVKLYEENLELNNLVKLINEVEKNSTGKTRPFREFMKEFKHVRKIQD
jgi:prevent-host-death family protein